MLGVAILTALLASLATVAIQLLLLLRFLSSSSSSSSSTSSSSTATYPPRGAVTTRHPRLLSLLRGAAFSPSTTTTTTSLSSTSSTTTTTTTTSSSSSSTSTTTSSSASPPYEACRCLNALLLSVFSELRDSAELRAWVTRKIHVEMLELLQSRTAGRLVEGLSLRDVSLGDALPVFHGVRCTVPPHGANAAGHAAQQTAAESSSAAAELPDELELEADVEYTGGCYVCVHAELVFGKRAELFVRIARVRGPLRVRVTRAPPLAHWSFAFTRDPRAELEVRSRYEGRPMPQLTTVIVNQIKKVLRRKHTLPSYKIRYKPFFPSHVQGDGASASLPVAELKRGTLKVQLVGCSRLLLPTAPDRETDVYCSLELAATKCTGGVKFLFIEIQISKGTSPLIGLTFRQISMPDGDPDLVVVSTVVPNTPAAGADVRKDDRVVSIAGHNVYSLVHAGKLLASADPVRIVLQREELPTGAVYSSHTAAGPSVSAPPVASASAPKNLPVDDSANPDSDFEDLCLATSNDTQAADETPHLAAVGFKQSTAPPAPTGAAAVAAAAKSASPGGSPSHSAAYCSKAAKASDGCAAECPAVPADANASESQDASGPADPSGPVKPPVPPRPKDKPESAPDAGGSARSAKGSAEQAAKAAAARADVAGAEEARAAGAAARADQWTSTKAAYSNNACTWTNGATADCAEFQVEDHHKYLNVLVWCQERVAPGARPACATATCAGHASVGVDEIVSECLDTGSLQFYRTYLLRPPDPKPAGLLGRPQFKQLASHKGFNEELCFGEVTLHFSHTYTDNFKGASAGPKAAVLKTGSLDNEASDSERDDGALRTREASKHDFKDALFQNPTNCDYCKNQIWTNSASRCSRCAYVCHKKCREKYQTEKPRCSSDGAGPRTRQTDRQRPQSMHKAAALARNLIPYARKRLQLRPGAKRTGDDGPPEMAHGVICETDGAAGGGADEGCDAADRTRRGSAGANRDGGLHDSVFVAVKEIGRALYRDLPSAERQQKLELMLEKLQCEIEAELERNSALKQDLAAASTSADPARATAELIAVEVRKSNERLQALTLLMLHYRAGLEDLELAQVDPPEAAPELAAHSEEQEERRGGNPRHSDDKAEGGGRESAHCGDLGGKARCAEATDTRPQGPRADVARATAAAAEQEEGGGGDDDQISLERVDVVERADVETSVADQRLEGTEEEASELEVRDDTDCEKT